MLLINTGSRRWPTLPRLVLATVLVLGASGALPARAQEQRGQVQPRQRDRERKAMSAFAAGRYQDALNLYADLYADYHDPVYLRNIGRCHYKMKDPEKAIASFEDYLSKYKRLTAMETDEVQTWIKEMRDLLKPTPPPEPVAAPPPVAPVAPVVVAPPPPPVKLTEKAPPRDDHHDRNVLLRKVGVGALIAGGALAVAGGAFMASSWSKYNSSKNDCVASCASDADSIDSRATVSKVLFISAGVVGGAGGALILLFPVDDPRTGTSVGLGVSTSFTY